MRTGRLDRRDAARQILILVIILSVVLCGVAVRFGKAPARQNDEAGPRRGGGNTARKRMGFGEREAPECGRHLGFGLYREGELAGQNRSAAQPNGEHDALAIRWHDGDEQGETGSGAVRVVRTHREDIRAGNAVLGNDPGILSKIGGDAVDRFLADRPAVEAHIALVANDLAVDDPGLVDIELQPGEPLADTPAVFLDDPAVPLNGNPHTQVRIRLDQLRRKRQGGGKSRRRIGGQPGEGRQQVRAGFRRGNAPQQKIPRIDRQAAFAVRQDCPAGEGQFRAKKSKILVLIERAIEMKISKIRHADYVR